MLYISIVRNVYGGAGMAYVGGVGVGFSFERYS